METNFGCSFGDRLAPLHLSAQHTSFSSPFAFGSTRSPKSRPIVLPNVSSNSSKHTFDNAESNRPYVVTDRVSMSRVGV